MSAEEQENFEDYLELEQYIEQLRLDKPAHPPANLTPQQVPIYRMAMLFHAASPHVADPSPEFSTQLYQRLREQVHTEAEAKTEDQTGIEDTLSPSVLRRTRLQSHPKVARLQENQLPTNSPDVEHGEKPLAASHTPTTPPPDQGQFRKIYSNYQASQPTQTPSTHPESADAKKHKKSRVSRRTLFTGGSLVAASLAAGAGIRQILEPQTGTGQQTHTDETATPTPQPDPGPLVGNVATTWQLVTSTKQLGKDPVAFTSDAIVGYVIRQQDNTSGEQIIAFSAACTHLGCIVHWQETPRTFLCPCHERSFDAAGKSIDNPNGHGYLTPLPNLETKTENGNIYVKVPLRPQ